MRFTWLVSLLLGMGIDAVAETAKPAHFVITNATVITVNDRQPSAEAVAVRGNRILFVGSNSDASQWIGPETEVLNARGKTIMPGIHDGHVHSYRAAISELGGGAPLIHSIAEAQDWIRKQAATRPKGSWIVLERVYASRMAEQRLPTKKELDEAAPDNPVHWNSGPVSVANSRALTVSGITKETPQPAPGEIVKDPETGEPTGLLRNAAHLLKGAVSAYRPTVAEHRVAVKKLHALYNQRGITSINERRSDPEAIDLFRELARSGELTVRVNCTRVYESVPKSAEEAIRRLPEMTNAAPGKLAYGPTGVGDDWVKIGPLKVFLDGGMLIGTAYMKEPWGVSDMYQITDPSYRGILNLKPEVLNPLYIEAAKQGWQLTAHCTGEASPGILLDCYEQVAQELGLETVRDRRFQITHANFIDREDLQRARRLNVGADIQPAWLYKDGATLLKILGERRMRQFQPLRDWLRQRLPVGGGSDHMVQLDSLDSTNPWNPWLGIWIALSRQTERGGVLDFRQRLLREQAIQLYTINNARMNHEERDKGSIEPGKLADLILIDRNVLSCRMDDVRHTKVLLTMVDGKVVWRDE